LSEKASYGIIVSVKAIKYTRHARNRMRLHRITESEIESTINNPDFSKPSSEDRFNVWKKIDEKFLRVTYKEESNRILVITAVKKKKGWR
jgi:hypothetical protein